MGMACVSVLGRKRNYVGGGGGKFVSGSFRDLRRPEVFLNHPRAHRGIRGGVNQNEAPGRTAAGVGIEKKRHVRLKLNGTYLIHLQSSRRFVRERIDVDAMANGKSPNCRLPSGLFDDIGAAPL